MEVLPKTTRRIESVCGLVGFFASLLFDVCSGRFWMMFPVFAVFMWCFGVFLFFLKQVSEVVNDLQYFNDFSDRSFSGFAVQPWELS